MLKGTTMTWDNKTIVHRQVVKQEQLLDVWRLNAIIQVDYMKAGSSQTVYVGTDSLLCLKTLMVEPESLAPSTSEAWFSSSLRIRQPCKTAEGL